MSEFRDRLARDWAPTLYRRQAMPEGASTPTPVVEEELPAELADAIAAADAVDHVATGVMVALFVPPAIGQDLVIDGGEPLDQLHVTLAYLGKVDEIGDREVELIALVQEWASTEPALTGEVAGKGLFTAGPAPVTYASVDVPGLEGARERLVAVLERSGFPVSHVHGYTPHITLAYANRIDVHVPSVKLAFDGATVAWGPTQSGAPFGAPALAPAIEPADAESTTVSGPASGGSLLFGLGAQEARQSVDVPQAKAFVTEVSGRTLLTAPASTFAPTWEKALTPNKHFLWMQGRFVGAETPNRNSALWSAGDLELGHATVQHGPLNWLHEARHVIGTIADARYIPGSTPTAAEAAAETVDPHIVAASAIWRWIYPDEAWVIEQASDASKLWYSMECISESVQCVGDNSCGTEVAYGAYMDGLGCQHMAERSAVRRFVDPTFLGGAVIVPPVRPGWADADASVMRQAASLAEKAFADAGQPDVSASEWELLMAQVVSFARGA